MQKSKHGYEIILHWRNEHQACIAEVPELPGCAANGQTYQEAITNAEVIIDEWMRRPRSSAGLYLSSSAVGFCTLDRRLRRPPKP